MFLERSTVFIFVSVQTILLLLTEILSAYSVTDIAFLTIVSLRVIDKPEVVSAREKLVVAVELEVVGLRSEN